MENKGNEIQLIPFDQIQDEVWGPKGTPRRDEVENQFREEMHAYFVGEAIKQGRHVQELTQEELGARIGVRKAQISRLENGKSSMTLSTLARVFKALGVERGVLDLGEAGRITLW